MKAEFLAPPPSHCNNNTSAEWLQLTTSLQMTKEAVIVTPEGGALSRVTRPLLEKKKKHSLTHSQFTRNTFLALFRLIPSLWLVSFLTWFARYFRSHTIISLIPQYKRTSTRCSISSTSPEIPHLISSYSSPSRR